jgi:hypothetical protein
VRSRDLSLFVRRHPILVGACSPASFRFSCVGASGYCNLYRTRSVVSMNLTPMTFNHRFPGQHYDKVHKPYNCPWKRGASTSEQGGLNLEVQR